MMSYLELAKRSRPRDSPKPATPLAEKPVSVRLVRRTTPATIRETLTNGEKELADGFYANPWTPPTPFTLRPGETVTDAKRFTASLRRRIEALAQTQRRLPWDDLFDILLRLQQLAEHSA